jgi:hypothetical protein
MFIPTGKAVHENLATRYVLIDALVADLCESDFSGVVEIRLGDNANYIIIDQGTVAAAIEKPVGAGLSKTTVSNLAKRARAERGSVSIYRYSSGVAGSIAGRFAAEPLYTNLSTDFADLEKLVLKLLREKDREWFVEVFTGGNQTLIHIVNEQYGIISSLTPIEVMLNASAEKPGAALHDLVQECQRTGGTFDVFFRPAHREGEAVDEPEPLREIDKAVIDEQILESENPIEEALLPPSTPAQSSSTTPPISATQATDDANEQAFNESVKEVAIVDEPDLAIEIKNLSNPLDTNPDLTAKSAAENFADEPFAELESLLITNGTGVAANIETVNEASRPRPAPVATAPEADIQDSPPRILPTRELMALPSNFDGLQDALKMADIRRLMGKIIKTIEEVHRGIEQKDNFQMHLRAGQLKIADAYPFLDPFGSEFEYLDGEVVFIGKVEPQAFINGLTDALIFAVTEAAQASAQPLRLRAYIAEELKNLLDRNREEFIRCELDGSIKQIAGPQM